MNCDVCSREVAESEAIQVWGKMVCVDCKPSFVQSRREGIPLDEKFELPPGFGERVVDFAALFALIWKVLRRDWLVVFGLSLMIGAAIELILLVAAPQDKITGLFPEYYPRLSFLLRAFVGVLSTLGISYIVNERFHGRTSSFKGALGAAGAAWMPAVGTGFVYGFIVFLLLLCLIVPGLIWIGYYTFSNCVVALRALSGKAALDYSKALVRGRWWSVVVRSAALSTMVVASSHGLGFLLRFVPPSQVISFGAIMIVYLFQGAAIVGKAVLFLNVDGLARSGPIGSAAKSEDTERQIPFEY